LSAPTSPGLAPRPVATPALKLTRALVTELNSARGVVLLLGEHGTGKDFAADAAVRLDCELPAVRLSVPAQSIRNRELLILLLEAMTGDPGGSSITDLLRSVRALLADRPRLVVLSPAEHLNRDTTALLRSLYDDEGSQLRLVLVGCEECEQQLNNEFGLRVSARVYFERLKTSELEATVRQLHPALAAAPLQVLKGLDENYAKGRLHAWALLASAAGRHCEQTGRPLDENAATVLIGRLGVTVRSRRRWGRAAA
jgi:hypothetical protein